MKTLKRLLRLKWHGKDELCRIDKRHEHFLAGSFKTGFARCAEARGEDKGHRGRKSEKHANFAFSNVRLFPARFTNKRMQIVDMMGNLPSTEFPHVGKLDPSSGDFACITGSTVSRSRTKTLIICP